MMMMMMMMMMIVTMIVTSGGSEGASSWFSMRCPTVTPGTITIGGKAFGSAYVPHVTLNLIPLVVVSDPDNNVALATLPADFCKEPGSYLLTVMRPRMKYRRLAGQSRGRRIWLSSRWRSVRPRWTTSRACSRRSTTMTVISPATRITSPTTRLTSPPTRVTFRN